MVQDNYLNVKKEIDSLCEDNNIASDKVTLIAVSKTKPISDIEKVYAAGCRDFGENKAQEMMQKYEELPKDIRWHFIGTLQKNKVKYVVGRAFLIHSVDSYELACEIQKRSEKLGVHTNILIEVNVAKEETKQGITEYNELMELVRKVSLLENVHIQGLMTIAPICETPSENAIYFQQLKDLSVDIKQKNIDNVCMDILSMGMSSDYEAAILEGATYVRVGTSIFGERDYSTHNKI